ncbi:MAG: hypothetical protein C6Y22_21225 [Hapalosiphonaceae cyanobacterium JJU2]|nr:MAG: hypothetical protein C6Y22_21225 [Hapalosiphonaceae cyanobacterium JJU2]
MILDDESLILNDESLILDDESLILDDESLNGRVKDKGESIKNILRVTVSPFPCLQSQILKLYSLAEPIGFCPAEMLCPA